MKKRISILLIAALMLSLFCLSGCGKAETPDVPAQAEATEETASDAKVVTLKAASALPTTDLGSLIFQYWCDQIEELSEGTIQIERFLGGTLCSLPEEYAYCSNGTIDMMCLLGDFCRETFPMAAVFTNANGDMQKCIDLWHWAYEENDVTASLIQAQAAENNVIFLGCQASGTMAIFSNKDWSSFDELRSLGLTLGATSSGGAAEAIGYANSITVLQADTYESLSKGVCDSTITSLSSGALLKYNEVAPYVCTVENGFSRNGFYFTFNLDTWNSLSEEQKEAVREASRLAEAYSVELSTNEDMDSMQAIEDAGGVIHSLSLDDCEVMFEYYTKETIQASRTYAENLGCEADYDTVVREINGYLGLDENFGLD